MEERRIGPIGLMGLIGLIEDGGFEEVIVSNSRQLQRFKIGQPSPKDHFEDFLDMVKIGSEARQKLDYCLWALGWA